MAICRWSDYKCDLYIRELREEGYLVPEWVIETIVIEQALGEGS